MLQLSLGKIWFVFSCVALCRTLGMRERAHHLEGKRFREAWVDDRIFALLAREWLKAKTA